MPSPADIQDAGVCLRQDVNATIDNPEVSAGIGILLDLFTRQLCTTLTPISDQEIEDTKNGMLDDVKRLFFTASVGLVNLHQLQTCNPV